MKISKTARNFAQSALGPFELLSDQVAKPIGKDFSQQLFGNFGEGIPSSRPQSIASEDLKRARDEQHIKNIDEEDQQASIKHAAKVREAIKGEYKSLENKLSKEQQQLHEEVATMQEEVVKLAKAAGVDTKVHVESSGKKLGILDLKRLTTIIRGLRLKAENAKSGSELVSQRQNAKRATGMMAWVSGKQMKIHEQGTMQLQG